MNVRVNRAERLFKMFDEDRDDKIYWTSFKEGIKLCMFGTSQELDDFIFRFFDLGEWSERGVLDC